MLVVFGACALGAACSGRSVSQRLGASGAGGALTVGGSGGTAGGGATPAAGASGGQGGALASSPGETPSFPGITDVRGDDRTMNPWTNYFGINPGASLDFRASFHLDASVAPGTRIHFVIWVDSQGAGCTNGNDAQLTLTVAT